jgi:hypothetical protein
MKGLNMKDEFCQNCGLPLIYVKHIEDDGFDGSDESYYECPDGCDQPTEPRVETGTEFGRVIVTQEPQQLSFII